MVRNAARTATTRTVTDINRTAVLDALTAHGPLSRSDLRRVTGLSPATIDRLCAALLEEQLVVRAGVERSSGGRPSTLLRFAGERRVIVTVEVAAAGPRGMLMGLDGSRSDRRELPTPTGSDPNERLETLLTLIDDLLTSAKVAGRTCLGIAVVVPGVVDDRGRVSNSAELGWQQLDVGSIVGHRFGLPTLVENDANAIAFGEWAHGPGDGVQSLVALVLGVGVGAGIVSDGALVRGARSGAGEVGYLVTDRSAFGRVFARQGDLESRIGAVPARYTGPDAPTDAAGLLAAAAAGDPLATELAAELLDHLAFAVVALATVIDPAVVVLHGHLPADGDWVVRQLELRLAGRIPFPPTILRSGLGTDAALAGVGELMARRTKGSVYLA
ncbi:ROK family protein [Cellulomonas soli]|uniref:ROK family protein n=1 Tax=Cellulomonas soli TaxID=931535 RepID=UPI003F877B8D